MSHSPALTRLFAGFRFTFPILIALTCNSLNAQDTAAELAKATAKVANEKFQLEYKFQTGEKVFYEVVHQMAVDTKVEENTEKMKSRTKALSKWDFTKVGANGDVTFSNTVDYVNMWSELTGREPQRYDSRTDKEVPAQYENVAKTIGKPIAIVTASKQGDVLKRDDIVKQLDRSTGGLLVPLPPQPIGIGFEWDVPSSVTVRHKDGRRQAIKTRQLYKLENVAAGVATISLTTQVLTPVNDPKIDSQLVQKLSKGELKFDMDAGRMISKQLNWNEVVVGFNGPQSSMKFLARMTERLVPAAEVASLREPPKTR